MVMQLRGCCCCFSLRTGTIIIAVLGLLSGISFMFEGIFQTGGSVTPSNSTHTNASIIVQPTLIPNFNITGNGTDVHDVPGEHGFRVSQTIYGVLETIICALLLVGAIRNSPKLIFPWIFASVILCILGIIIFLGIGIVLSVADLVGLGLTYIVFGAIATIIHVYFILVVNSFHSTLKTGQVSRA